MLKRRRWHRYIQVLYVLGWLAKQNGKNYCYPSQDKILWLLYEKYNISYSRRHLNRILKLLEDAGFIKRKRRHKKGKNGGIEFNSTLYLLTSKAFKLLGRSGVFLKPFLLPLSEKLKDATEKNKEQFDPFSLPQEEYIRYMAEQFEKRRQLGLD